MLVVDENRGVYDVNHMEKLRTLSARGSCGIDGAGMSRLQNLVELYASGNTKLLSFESQCGASMI